MGSMTAGVPRRCLGRCGKLVMPPASRCTGCAAAIAPPWKRHGWTAIRNASIKAQPWCGNCGATERLEVDHIVPLADGGALDGPTQVLCHDCHVKVGVERRGKNR